LGLVDDTVSEVQRRVDGLDQYLRSASFQQLFDAEENAPEPDSIKAAASRVIAFYRANLMLARKVRGVATPDEYREIIENTAHLVDRSLEGVDQFITQLLGTLAMLPSLQQRNLGHREFHPILLNLHMDNALAMRIVRQLNFRRQPWRRWLWPW
jgi:hypothetical protein